MNELVNAAPGNFRKGLLRSASALALIASIYGTPSAFASDIDRPTVWIDLGGGFDQMSAVNARWLPPNLTPPISNPPPEPFGHVPVVGYEFDGGITIQPSDSDWVYSASLRYGRGKYGPKRNHDQTYTLKISGPKYVLTNDDFANSTVQSSSSHAILDFSVGKDVGIGAFHSGRSTIHFGVRAVQLNERSDAHLTAFVSAPAKYSPGAVSHTAQAVFARSFTGAGPSVSWDGAAPLMGSTEDNVSFDWGANAAILFGQQKAHVALHTQNAQYYNTGVGHGTNVLSHSTDAPRRDRTVVVPNLGAFACLSWRLPNSKISLGYRADFFFGAIDGGISTSQKELRGFYGPFASVSIGLGG